MASKSSKSHLPGILEACEHDSLTSSSSPYATESNYKRPLHKLTAKKRKRDHDNTNNLFPAPLILPGDELALDPKYPAQSVRSWQRDKNRNAVTHKRNIIYVAAPPRIDEDVEIVNSWTLPTSPRQQKHTIANKSSSTSPSLPAVEDIVSYLSAFYHPLPIKPCPVPLTFTTWEDTSPPPRAHASRKRQRKPSAIALRTDTSKTQIRTRSPSPGSLFPTQLNLNDLIDVAIDILPCDAYALLLLVSHDLYEDDNDVFVCGRAYGGSRVAVISTARYNPELDEAQGVDRKHAWPASHCTEFIDAICDSKSSGDPNMILPKSYPLHLALSSHLKHPPEPSLLWLIRTALTSAHELGHCFGLDHCVYYACCMQGSASLAEDARQPPYLCPVCEEKVLSATGADAGKRMKRLIDVAGQWGWGGLEEWCKTNLKVMEQGCKDDGKE
ncbi:MAG: hypothetical protein Q9209_001322 [Squamulea sp. 1 TL-2023]